MADKKIEYSFWIGAWKSIKNFLVIVGPGLVIYFTGLIESGTATGIWGSALGLISYLIKNYIDFNARNK